MNKFKIIGDHSKEHCGCAAVMDSIKNIIKKNHEIHNEQNDNYDCLLVNGEGSLHHGSKNFITKMEAIKQSINKGKKVYLINTVWQNNPSLYNDILKKIKTIIVREKLSQEDLFKNHNTMSIVRPDLSLQATINPAEKHEDLNGKIAITDFYSKEFNAWMKYTAGSYANKHYVCMKKNSWSQLVLSLQTSSILITGRHHAIYAACKSKTPFISLESNSHKISGLIKMSKIPLPICSSPNQFQSALKWANTNKYAYQDFFSFIDELEKFSLKDLGL